MKPLDVSARKLVAKNITMTVKVKGIGLALWRLRLAIPIVWVASKVAGTKFAVDLEKAERR